MPISIMRLSARYLPWCSLERRRRIHNQDGRLFCVSILAFHIMLDVVGEYTALSTQDGDY
jgi:hypothetical protein